MISLQPAKRRTNAKTLFVKGVPSPTSTGWVVNRGSLISEEEEKAMEMKMRLLKKCLYIVEFQAAFVLDDKLHVVSPCHER